MSVFSTLASQVADASNVDDAVIVVKRVSEDHLDAFRYVLAEAYGLGTTDPASQSQYNRAAALREVNRRIDARTV